LAKCGLSDGQEVAVSLLGSMNMATLIMGGMVWLVVATTLVLDLSGRKRRYSGFRWIGSSLLLIMSFMIFSEFAHDRNWPSVSWRPLTS
jgi:hypothetical protein